MTEEHEGEQEAREKDAVAPVGSPVADSTTGSVIPALKPRTTVALTDLP